MTASTLGPALRHVHTLYDRGTTAGLDDADLLGRFAEGRDEAAFEGLAHRHGSMVLASCRAILRDPSAAEDAFQATFLILARRDGSIRDGEALAPWLHRVARRVAVRARAEARSRARHEQAAGSSRRPAPGPTDDPSAALHEEIDRLPDRYRLPVVLCHLEGLTQAEAAARLRRGERTLRRHLAEALPRLKVRLVGRGIALSAAAFASLLADQAKACVPAAWAALAARVAGTGKAPVGVAALANQVLRASGGIKLPLASASAVGLVASACWLAAPILAGPSQDAPAMAPKPPSPAPAPVAQAAGTWTYSGRVVDPDGRPFAGARLSLANSYDPTKSIPEPRALSGPDGRFRFAQDQKGYGVASGIARFLHVTAQADGFGLGLSEGDEVDADHELTIRLARDDVPITGRVLDLEGRPVAGVKLRITNSWAGDSGDLTPFIAAAKLEGGGNAWWSKDEHLKTSIDFEPGKNTFPPVVTGPDGRFRLSGIGRERVVALRVEGLSVRLTEFEALNRDIPPFLIPDRPIPGGASQATFRGANFDLILPPSRPVEGVVRDQDTGRPIARAIVTEMEVYDENLTNRRKIRATSDARGRYRLEGLPKGAGNVIAILPPPDQPYLPAYKTIGDAPGLDPEVVDVALKRGIWAEGKQSDETTGMPINGTVAYHISPENKHFGEVPDFKAVQLDLIRDMLNPAPEGSYRVAVLPGPGLLSLKTAGGPYEFLDAQANQAGPLAGYAPSITAWIRPMSPSNRPKDPGESPATSRSTRDDRSPGRSSAPKGTRSRNRWFMGAGPSAAGIGPAPRPPSPPSRRGRPTRGPGMAAA